ncbi:MAG: helicase C-terminal domain-containing protein, partial [Candidatus Thorarchaeota archaeon]
APSYKYIEKIEEIGILKPDIFETQDMDITTLQAIISSSETKKMILCVVAGKISEGIEFTVQNKSLIKAIIVCALPYAPPSEENKLIYEDLLIQFGSQIAKEFTVVIPMTQKLAQSFGRAIRNKGDRAVHILLDPRGTKFTKDFNFERHKSVKTLKTKIIHFFA